MNMKKVEIPRTDQINQPIESEDALAKMSDEQLAEKATQDLLRNLEVIEKALQLLEDPEKVTGPFLYLQETTHSEGDFKKRIEEIARELEGRAKQIRDLLGLKE